MCLEPALSPSLILTRVERDKILDRILGTSPERRNAPVSTVEVRFPLVLQILKISGSTTLVPGCGRTERMYTVELNEFLATPALTRCFCRQHVTPGRMKL